MAEYHLLQLFPYLLLYNSFCCCCLQRKTGDRKEAKREHESDADIVQCFFVFCCVIAGNLWLVPAGVLRAVLEL